MRVFWVALLLGLMAFLIWWKSDSSNYDRESDVDHYKETGLWPGEKSGSKA